MFRQNEHHVSDASIKSQTRSGILTPASDNSLNDGFGGKKRKRDGNTMDDLLKDTFIARPYPSSASTRSRIFQPLLLLPRAYLPLSALDIAASAKALAQSRLFEAHVKILELEDRMGTQPMVVIARLNNSPTLFAVERESQGLYALCQLGSWINLQQLRTGAVACKQNVIKSSDISFTHEVPSVENEASKLSNKKRLAIEALQSKVKRPSTGLLTESPGPGSDTPITTPLIEAQLSETSTETQILGMGSLPPVEDAPAQPTPSEMFDTIRNQYLETLYLSKASLAYFAKGPLSRARAAFHLDYDSTLDMNDLISFLESLVLSTTMIEKKYRDAVPNCVSLIDVHDSAEEGQAAGKPKKRRSSKKIKLGKNGLYPTEEPLIRQWWTSHNDDAEVGAPGISKGELIKSRISQLRIRETQLQMIVILEILALQPLATAPEESSIGLPTTLPTIATVEPKDSAVKAKKPDHLSMLIDVHIDRLCIWQSVALESMKLHESNSADPTDGLQSGGTDNPLRDFCVEVIAPFFFARLPDRCVGINKKLGGPVALSPPKPKLPKSASFSGAPSKPGAATKRPVPAKPRERKTLQRVLTEERERSMSRGPNRAVSLMRSATMPVGLGLKREASESLSLSSIPAADTQMFPSNRGGIQSCGRFAQREVAMNTFMPKKTSKSEKQAMIDAELKNAISALKKPNRELAGKAIADTAEKRAVPASQSRKAKKPVRNPLFQGIQITATPRTNRLKNVPLGTDLPSSAKTIGSAESSFIPASSMPSVPQSVARSSLQVPGKNPLFAFVQATPTRRSTLGHPEQAADVSLCPASSPLHVRRSSAQLFNAVPDSAIKTTSVVSASHGVLETPSRPRFEDKLQYSHPEVPKYDSDKRNFTREEPSLPPHKMQVPVIEEPSIYKSLGWDDADDVDDLS